MGFKKSFNLKEWKNTKFKELNFGTHARVAVADGQVIDIANQPERLNILRVTEQLAKKGYIVPVGNTNTEDQANNLLESMGCCVSKEGRDFSLMDEQTDKEQLENPNIIDEKALKNKKNKQIKITDKFANADDPIFQMDDPPTRREQSQNKEINKSKRNESLPQIAADLAGFNLSDGTLSLKYFK